MSGDDNPLVTILMPVLNVQPDYLREAIDSIRSQTYPNWELVVVEDPSPNLATAIIASYADSPIRHFMNSERTSLAQQLNRGIKEARGAFIARMDADDVAVPRRLAAQVAFLLAHREVMIVGSQLEIIDADGKHLGYRNYPLGDMAIRAALRRFNALAHPSVMFRKQQIQQAGGYRHPEFQGPEATGIFGLACQAGTLVFSFAWLGIRVIQPHLSGEYGLHREFIRKLILFMSIFLVALGSICFAGATGVIWFAFDPVFRSAIIPMAILISAAAFLSAGVPASLYLLRFHQERRVLFVYAISSAIYLGASALLVPQHGIDAAAWITLGAALIGFVLMMWFATRLRSA